MCGVAGLVAHATGSIPPAAERAIAAALGAMGHRGPDGTGVVSSAGFVFGHRRLSIVDVEGGAQPLVDHRTGDTIAYNGEIYGYQRIATEMSRSLPFQTRSDTEVLLRALQQGGVAALGSLNGMYAFASALDNRSRVVMARDPLGIKPLYVYSCAEWTAFASELRALAALLRQLDVPLQLSRKSLARYLRFGWIEAPDSLLASVQKLLPGEIWLLDHAGPIRKTATALRKISQASPSIEIGRSFEIKDLIGLLDAVVADQLVADVPVGVFLSGGIDSSIVAALARRHQRELFTFSIGFEKLLNDARVYDESESARQVARQIGSQHFELQLEEPQVLASIDKIVQCVDEPIADPAVIPLFFLSQWAAQHVKVCLSGDGGDELFGGYRHHVFRRWRSLLVKDSLFATGAAGLVRRGSQLLPSRGLGRRARALAALLSDCTLVPPLFDRTAWPHALGTAAPDETAIDWSQPDALLLAELTGPLASGMLHKTDRVTMYHSIEARVPLLDDRVVAFARALPWQSKVRGFTSKWILREALHTILPAAPTSRSKRGFRVPLDEWFRGSLATWIESKLGNSTAMEAVFGDRWISQQLASGSAGGATGQHLWALAVLEPWISSYPVEGHGH